MCGIVGYTGCSDATKKVLKGLEILEYRGYDSAGICRETELGQNIIKTTGRVKALCQKAENKKEGSFCAIGHTRWATHGAVSERNAHPHRVGGCTLVHNGIIENYKELREKLALAGACFVSETDSEVGCALINEYYGRENDPFKAILCATEELCGSYALAIMLKGHSGRIYAVRRGSPLIIGKGSDGHYLASDLTAIIPFTRTYYPLEEGEIAELSPQGVKIYGVGEPAWKTTEMSFEASKKGGYEHFMLKEMWEQPQAVKKCLSPRVSGALPCALDRELLNGIKEIHIVACGSAMHAGLFGASLIQELAGVRAQAYIASEYRYKMPVTDKGTLVIIVSQSGETADSIACLRHAKERGLTTLGVVNAVETTIAREADICLYTYAGPEVAVATTKGYMTQASLLSLIGVNLGLEKGKISAEMGKRLTQCLIFNAPRAIEGVLKREKEIENIAKKLYERNNIFYIGRGIDYALAQEASLKLKEISYIHCEAYAAGELKHGTISLIEKGTPVIAIATEKRLFDKLDSNIKEVKSRGAFTVLICTKNIKNARECADLVLEIESEGELDGAFGAVAAVQMLAYRIARLRGCDIDKPRNLAKSVTVE